MKKVAIMQPYIFPYIGYFQLINEVNEFVIFDDVNYIKRGWINRNAILTNGEKLLLTISLSKASSNKLINEIEIVDDFNKFKKSIENAYSKAPYREVVYKLITRICSYEDKNLARFIGNSFVEITSYLGIETKFIYSSDLKKNNQLKGQDKIIAICKELQADIYVNSIGGRELYSKEEFAGKGIRLKFLKPSVVEYKQLGKQFIQGLSIIDVMMFNSVDDIKKMLDRYELI